MPCARDPRWKFAVEEVSPNVYRAVGVDSSGRRVEHKGTDPGALLAECERDASALDRPASGQESNRARLRSRWHGEGRDGAAAAVAFLLGDDGRREQFGLHDGRTDLRGLTLPSPRELGEREIGPFRFTELADQVEFDHVRWRGIDLSAAVLDDIGFARGDIRDCVFDGASMRRVRVHASEIEGSSFADVDLRESGLGPWDPEHGGNTYTRCSFERADLRDVACSAAIFVSCDFTGAALHDINFWATRFDACRFAGELREVIFDIDLDGEVRLGNELRDCDFTAARLRWVEFRRLSLAATRMPEDDDHLVVRDYGCVARRLVRQLAKAQGPLGTLHSLVETDMRWMHPRREVGIFNRHDLVELGGSLEDVEAVAVCLRTAEAECGARRRRTVRFWRRSR